MPVLEHPTVMSRVLAVSGSLRAASYHTQILRSLQPLAPGGMRIELFEGLGDLPHFSEDLEADPPASVRRLRQAVADADGLIIATPEYNGGIPGVLKNAFDWASRPRGESVLPGHSAMVLSASPGLFGGIRAQAQLREMFALLNVYVVGGPQVIIPQVHTRVDPSAAPERRLTDSVTRAMLAALLHGLEEAVDHQAGSRLIRPLHHWQNQPTA